MSDTDKLTLDSHLTRTARFEVVRDDDTGDGLTLEGYGAVFDEPTRIDSWEGRFDEVIAPGAFKRTIGRKGPEGIRLQFDHGSHPLIGALPLGRISELREDDRGLFVRARLHDNWLVEPFRDAIRDGSVEGMSFRFRVVKEAWDDTGDLPVRTLREIELFEVGPVVWPAYDTTSVGVRAQEIAAALMDPEQRVAVARALLAGTSDDDEAPSPDPDDAVPSGDPDLRRDDEPAEDPDPADLGASDSLDEPTADVDVASARRPAPDRSRISLLAASVRERTEPLIAAAGAEKE